MRKRLVWFRVIVLSVFSSLYFYFTLSLTGAFFALPISLWILLIMALVLFPPLYFWTTPNRGEQRFEIAVQILCNWAQGYFSYLLTLIVLRDLLGFGFRIEISPWWPIFLPLALQTLGQFPLWFGPFLIETQIPTNNLPKDLEGFKIVQISDLHIGPGVRQKYVEKVVAMVNAQSPDIVVLTGDIVDHLDKWFGAEINLLAKLRGKYGVYYIPGNHEYYWGYAPTAKKLSNLGLHVFDNDSKVIAVGGAQIGIAGVVDYAARMFDLPGPDARRAAQGLPASAYKILLAHQPKIADEAATLGFDLQLSGHTHAGQFVPWSLIIGLFQKYSKGLYRIGTMNLYVNQGTGFWGPKDRLGTKPEISVLRLAPSAKQNNFKS